MIIYIHGFASSGEGHKAKLFREYFINKNEKFMAPSLSYIPELAIQTLEEIIKNSQEKISLMGSSLGGYYATYLAHKYNLKAVLINPSAYPYITLQKTLGFMQSFYDGSSFQWRESHLQMLKKYEVQEPKQENFLLLLQKGDETLNYKEAADKFSKAALVIEEGGSHSFDDIERYFDKTEAFLR
ncbi:esterase [Sulfurimonas sp. SWIR-19]|uniref:YqiA/YcfP family alpha/beta fold hydrolase n=1 Tax=Sulfurimonas sp. SWIR-19 TaxID=2878390 RepID=UPI001CF5519E|nr:YqiA/YcfP family alpha/beta fold hydrolase [Sulfurimonas sp. SWIR-19]UCM99263.1 esterase [Sulfurimonas sp. SWIR-19]